MKLNAKKEAEIKVWEWFAPKTDHFRERNDEELKIFFEWSEQGKHKDRLGLVKSLLKNPDDYHSYASKLVIGKRWAGITIHELWEDSFLKQSGWPGMYELLGGYDTLVKRKWWQFWKPRVWFVSTPIPVEVKDFIKKEFLRGSMSDQWDKVYEEVVRDSMEGK